MSIEQDINDICIKILIWSDEIRLIDCGYGRKSYTECCRVLEALEQELIDLEAIEELGSNTDD